MSFALSFVDASEAVLVVSPEATSFVCLTRYTALTEWVFVRLAAFSEIKEGFSYATASLIVKRKPDIYLKKLGVFAVVPNYGTLLAFAHDTYGEQIRVLLTMMLALTAILFVLQNMVSCVKCIFRRSGILFSYTHKNLTSFLSGSFPMPQRLLGSTSSSWALSLLFS